MRRTDPPLCPSARPEWDDAMAIGVVGGTAEKPRVRPLQRPLPVTRDLLALANPVEPTEVFRFAATCQCDLCDHYADASCTLAAKVARMVPPAGADLPACDIRPRCRWFRQEGREACLRCPLIVTNEPNPSPLIRLVADPATPVPTSPQQPPERTDGQ
jgi:hypothetical protein